MGVGGAAADGIGRSVPAPVRGKGRIPETGQGEKQWKYHRQPARGTEYADFVAYEGQRCIAEHPHDRSAEQSGDQVRRMQMQSSCLQHPTAC